MPLLEALIQTVTPHACLSCQAEGSLLCDGCALWQCPSLAMHCFRCLQPTPQLGICPACRPQTALENVWVATEYTSLAKELVRKLKFDRAQAAVQPMARLINQRMTYLDEDTVIVPVPTATGRVRQRGCDQARELARQLARGQRRPLHRLLKRATQTRQVGANRQQRLQQLSTAFYTPKRHLPHRVLLVDDVITTGATLESAARVLQQAGVRHISAVAFAQKV